MIDLIRRSVPLIRQGVKLGAILTPEYADAAETLEPMAEALETAAESIGTDQPSTEDAEAAMPKIDSPDAFTSALSEAAKNWSEQHPVVIMVDELDRCSPEYAVEMLQLLEHIFYAENVVFVVSMNRGELVHSVKVFYGDGFDADGYLERFFDDVFGLPSSNRVQYIRSSISKVSKLIQDKPLWDALRFLDASALSLREIDRAVEQLKEVLERGPSENATQQLAYLWIVRTLAPVEYRRFLSRELSDRVLADSVFSNGACAVFRTHQRHEDNSHAYELETTLMSLSSELHFLNQVPMSASSSATLPSELHAYHKANSNASVNTENDLSPAYSKRVINNVERSIDLFYSGIDRSSLIEATRLLERDAPPQKERDEYGI